MAGVNRADGDAIMAPAFTFQAPALGRTDQRIARFYVGQAVVLSTVCSAWTLNNYRGGSNAQHIFSLLSIIVTASLCTGLLAEAACYQRDLQPQLLSGMRQRGQGYKLVHVACATAGVLSICVAAVNVYEGANDWLYGMSLAVIVLHWVFWSFFTPAVTMQLVVYSKLTDAEKKTLDIGQASATYVFRNAYVLLSD